MNVLFLGEGDLSGAARYLAAILTWAKIPYDHRPDEARLPKRWRGSHYDVVILSDYRYASWTPCAKEWLLEQVTVRGTGLLMIGGWASFTGLVGGYAGTDLERLLPVTCVRGDDRVNRSAMLMGAGNPPVVCGYHRAKPKPGTQIPYVFRDLIYKNGRVTLGVPQPALVLGRAGRARTAAFLTDCAPHWAGGLVDWGRRRVSVKLGRYGTVEVGEQYLRFFRSLFQLVAK